MKIVTFTTRTLLLLLLVLALGNCESEDVPVTSKTTTPNNLPLARTGILDKITISTTDVTSTVQSAFSGRTSKTVSQVFAEGDALQSGLNSTTTKLVSLNKFKFGTNEQKNTRRPQGLANYGNYVIHGWYFTSESTWEDNCKLTIADLSQGKYFNIVPVQLHTTQTNKFKHIDSHASGLTVVGHYLYMANSASILVFDLNKIYKIIKPSDPDVASGQNFIYEYTFMLPQVGEIIFDTDSGAKASYLSQTLIDSVNHFVVGNFYSTVSSSYSSGGKSMIWTLPVTNTSYSFPTIQTNASRIYPQIDPVFPSGDEIGQELTRIQGAIIKDNVLIMNRSYQDETYQLLVIRYANIFADPLVITDFFTGTTSNPHGYNNKNWLYGCEDMEYYNGRVYTVTEFPEGLFGDRASYSGTYASFISLMDPI
ncbi:MAG TPA: hypothetical protein PK325_03215 [Cyclobacteriaceae bacterium]|nr:hypothetical protein [Cyclobacteriaceae bacterium]HMV09913.1 hypothetical protein [Cyclobacteriaceae bacterium]HMV88863.1 hypothetical protein [Cyclobacteriaceae bacterium]HMW99651.1 hypothetical protein [Cyclobacteriaceae bacterium]HMX50972.1 hypothetical protein [Cyclobacteriaceae bacterium]